MTRPPIYDRPWTTHGYRCPTNDPTHQPGPTPWWSGTSLFRGQQNLPDLPSFQIPDADTPLYHAWGPHTRDYAPGVTPPVIVMLTVCGPSGSRSPPGLRARRGLPTGGFDVHRRIG